MTRNDTRHDGFVHQMVDIDGGELTFHTVTVGSGDPVFLLHGFPQTWYEWRHIMHALKDTHTLIAVDLKGAGYSSKPVTGYDKATMAAELDRLRIALGHDHVQVVGHDIGAMLAYAWAATSREAITRLAVVDAPIPGTEAWRSVLSDARLWHFAFQMKRDVPEMLITGREHAYVAAFLRDRAFNHGALTDDDIDIYARAFALPGSLRGGLEWYRAFPEDDEFNRRMGRDSPLSIPVLATGGDRRWGPRMVEMMSELAHDVVGESIMDCNHWVPEERPDELARALRRFLSQPDDLQTSDERCVW